MMGSIIIEWCLFSVIVVVLVVDMRVTCVCVGVCLYMSRGLRHPSARTGHSCDRRAVVPSYLISFSFINAVAAAAAATLCCSASGDCAAARPVGGGGRPFEL